ncbi:carboxypeptidase M32 [Tumebacillus algifaecis]|uniref:Metal-dependent carboxypeptidase n=1 Tax=Tumebacillus algifaecis TaxID=1214604 RepID=A0A223CYW7_9BACL|nr:carboxypeptidase M32 [Tumebacillus algifaecis]ASS74333.1 carboxypeptidase M32 [Tumebacillus algifaecis]
MSTEKIHQTANDFNTYVRRMKQLHEAIQLIQWDMSALIPKQGVAQRAEVVGMLSGDLFQMQTSDQMGEYLDVLSRPEAMELLDPITRASVLDRKTEYDRDKSIPPEKFREYVVLTQTAESAWDDAKRNNDFEIFRPYLEQIVAILREFIEIWGYKENKYDALLSKYEPGLTVAKLDTIFGGLREKTIDLLRRVTEQKQVNRSFLHQPFPRDVQYRYSRHMLDALGFDFSKGRFDESPHPFAIGLNPNDVRITTFYYDNDITASLFGTIHEFGHAIYEQNISHDLIGTFLCTGTSMGIHESQSRFWENMIGRGREFWQHHFASLVEHFPAQFAGVSAEDYFKAINFVEPSLIRVDADELTYNLHIMLRYEIEKDLINGKIEVKDLPEIWADKIEEYVGVRPDSHATGVLQDIHWSGGAFGYFSSYSLGNIYAAQLEHAMQKEIPNYREQVAAGDVTQVLAWMNEKVYKHGKLLTPGEIMLQATGEEINSEYLVAYLESKFKEIYGI